MDFFFFFLCLSRSVARLPMCEAISRRGLCAHGLAWLVPSALEPLPSAAAEFPLQRCRMRFQALRERLSGASGLFRCDRFYSNFLNFDFLFLRPGTSVPFHVAALLSSSTL